MFAWGTIFEWFFFLASKLFSHSSLRLHWGILKRFPFHFNGDRLDCGMHTASRACTVDLPTHWHWSTHVPHHISGLKFVELGMERCSSSSWFDKSEHNLLAQNGMVPSPPQAHVQSVCVNTRAESCRLNWSFSRIQKTSTSTQCQHTADHMDSCPNQRRMWVCDYMETNTTKWQEQANAISCCSLHFDCT